MTVRTQPVPNVIVLPGRVHSVRSAEVRARVDGIVERRLYDEGTDVRAGQALFAIDPRQLRASLNAVLASLSRAQANAANAQQDVNRYRPLLVDQAISKQEYDAAVARLRTAQADVAQARAQVESARLSLGYTIVIAPISGRAGRAEVTEGALVSASAGTLMTNIEQLDPIYVDFGQSSANLLEVRREIAAGKLNLPSLNTIEVQLELEDGTRYGPMGRIDFLDLSIGEETGTAAVRAQFPNPGRLLLPGQFVRARILAGTREGGIVLPQRAIRVTKDGGTAMVVGEGNRVEVRRVKLGDLRGGLWVVSEGLRPGERVIVNGLQKAQPGQPVRIAPPRPVRSPPPSAK
jgi:membrane fusion protein (multidrug efflux system)